MKIQTIYDEAKAQVAKAVATDDAHANQARSLITLGGQQQDLESQLAEVKADLDAIIKTPAPQELLDDKLDAIRNGQSIKDYCESKGKKVWNLDLYTEPTSDEWKAQKKEARLVKEANNLAKFDSTIEKLSADKKAGNLTCTTLQMKGRKQGGYSFKMAGYCGGAPAEKISVKDAFAELTKQLDNK